MVAGPSYKAGGTPGLSHSLGMGFIFRGGDQQAGHKQMCLHQTTARPRSSPSHTHKYQHLPMQASDAASLNS